MPRHLSIDIETYSEADIKECGLYRYAEDDSFEIMLFSYAYDFGDPVCVDLAQGEKIPEEVFKDLASNFCIKHAYNAVFEITCLNRVFPGCTNTKTWVDTMALGSIQGLPMGLDAVGKVLGLEEDKAKITSGKALVLYFSKPCKPTKTNGGRTRNLPKHDPEKWKLYKEYNRQDVVAEMAVYKLLSDTPVTYSERLLYLADLAINARGVEVDMSLVDSVIRMDIENRARLEARAKEITKLENPNSPQQLQPWLARRGCRLENLQASTISDKLSRAVNMDPLAYEMLTIRQALSKTSIKKFYTMKEAVCKDNRIRGTLQYYGSRTGRWAGRLVQVQNLKRNDLNDIGFARELAKKGDTLALELGYGDLTDTLSQLCRTAFVPAKGKKFIVADFSAIEARVLAWLAGEQWVIDTFLADRDIYCETASQMFGVRVEKHGENSHLRQKGKIAVLALGYGGGMAALRAMGGERMGLSENEMSDILKKYRNSNPNITNFWKSCEDAAKGVTLLHGQKTVGLITFKYELMNGRRPVMTIQLPNGRKLFYQNPHMTNNRFGGRAVAFYSVNSARQWGEEETYGGKLVENIVQATARDCLAETILALSNSDRCRVVMHIHDEVVCEADEDVTLDEITNLMGQKLEWAYGLPLKAAGFEGYFYKKD